MSAYTCDVAGCANEEDAGIYYRTTPGVAYSAVCMRHLNVYMHRLDWLSDDDVDALPPQSVTRLKLPAGGR